MTIPFDEIKEVKITKKYLILKSLHIVLKSGAELVIRFGAMSPKVAEELISSRLSH